MTNLIFLKEAIASVALAHPETCDCLTCRAARGNEVALLELLEVMDDELGL